MSSVVSESVPSIQPALQERPRTRYVVQGDLLRTAGAMVVVLVHVAHEGTRLGPWIGTWPWWWCATFEAVGRWAVPVFLMLGGAILLDRSRQESTQAFYKRRFQRIGMPMVFWSAFYLGWYVYFQQPVMGLEPMNWRMLVELLLAGTIASHLHYLGALLGLYLFTPMLRVYVRNAPLSQVRWATALILVITILSDLAAGVQGHTVLENALLVNRFLPYLGYYMLGYCLRDVRLKGWGYVAAVTSLAAAILVTVVGTRYLLPKYGFEHGGFYLYGQLSPTRVLMAMPVFLLGLPVAERLRGLGRLCAWCAPLTLGVYLVHPIFMDLLAAAGLYVMTPNVWVGLWLRTACVYGASLAAVWLIRRVPGGQHVIG